MMPDDSLNLPDYSTPGKKKQLVESVRREMQEAAYDATGDDERGFLQSPYGERRQKAILASLERAEKEFQGFGLASVIESFSKNELSPLNNYNFIDSDADLRIGAALWILDKLRAAGRLHDAFKILPDTAGDPDVWYLPTDFHHPCFDNDLIQSVIYVMTTRYGVRSGVVTEENARGKQPGETWVQLLALLPEEDVKDACQVFREKVWELAGRNMQGLAYYDKAIVQLYRRIQNAKAVRATAGLQAGPFAQKPGKGMPGFPPFDGLPGLEGINGPQGTDPIELARQGQELVEQRHVYEAGFDYYLQMERKQIWRETGSREVADAVEGFTVEEPYSLCFALFYLIDNGDDTPWLMRSGCALMAFVRDMLPWCIREDDWDDEDWDTWFDGMQYDHNGWLEKGHIPDQLDFYHEKHNGKNLAQVIYSLCRGIVPSGLHPFEEDRQQLITEGMEESKARKVTDIAEMIFLHAFQARQYGTSDWGMDDRLSENEKGIEREAEKAIGPASPVRMAGYWGRVAAEQGIVVEAADNMAAEENARLREELDQAKKQIKSLRSVLSEEKHTADADRARYERELKSLRMEHRELADLRSLVFNQENKVREEPVKGYSYPYETRKRTVIFGGHDSFLRAIKPMLPGVKFVDANNLTFDPDIIRNADVVWIQNNCISHTQYWNIVRNCKLAGVQMRYFGFAGAEKCAEQLVSEDLKPEAHN